MLAFAILVSRLLGWTLVAPQVKEAEALAVRAAELDDSDRKARDINAMGGAMSLIGTKQTCDSEQSTSAFGGKADITVYVKLVATRPSLPKRLGS